MNVDQFIRLECLKLADAPPTAGTDAVVTRARAYYDFVTGADRPRSSGDQAVVTDRAEA